MSSFSETTPLVAKETSPLLPKSANEKRSSAAPDTVEPAPPTTAARTSRGSGNGTLDIITCEPSHKTSHTTTSNVGSSSSSSFGNSNSTHSHNDNSPSGDGGSNSGNNGKGGSRDNEHNNTTKVVVPMLPKNRDECVTAGKGSCCGSGSLGGGSVGGSKNVSGDEVSVVIGVKKSDFLAKSQRVDLVLASRIKGQSPEVTAKLADICADFEELDDLEQKALNKLIQFTDLELDLSNVSLLPEPSASSINDDNDDERHVLGGGNGAGGDKDDSQDVVEDGRGVGTGTGTGAGARARARARGCCACPPCGRSHSGDDDDESEKAHERADEDSKFKAADGRRMWVVFWLDMLLSVWTSVIIVFFWGSQSRSGITVGHILGVWSTMAFTFLDGSMYLKNAIYTRRRGILKVSAIVSLLFAIFLAIYIPNFKCGAFGLKGNFMRTCL